MFKKKGNLTVSIVHCPVLGNSINSGNVQTSNDGVYLKAKGADYHFNYFNLQNSIFSPPLNYVPNSTDEGPNSPTT